MDYELSAGSFFFGLIVLGVGILFVRFYQWVANNFGSGVASYERYKLYAILTCVAGFVIMLNIHIVFLEWFFGLLFGSTR